MSDPIFEKALEHMQKVEEQEEVGSIDEIIDAVRELSRSDLNKFYYHFMVPRFGEDELVEQISDHVSETAEEDEKRLMLSYLKEPVESEEAPPVESETEEFEEEPPVESKTEEGKVMEADYTPQKIAKMTDEELVTWKPYLQHFAQYGTDKEAASKAKAQVQQAIDKEIHRRGIDVSQFEPKEEEEVEEGKVPDDKDSEEVKIKKLTEQDEPDYYSAIIRADGIEKEGEVKKITGEEELEEVLHLATQVMGSPEEARKALETKGFWSGELEDGVTAIARDVEKAKQLATEEWVAQEERMISWNESKKSAKESKEASEGKIPDDKDSEEVKIKKLTEEERRTDEAVSEEDVKKLIPLVRKVLAKDLVGDALEDAVDGVARAILRNLPDILTDKEHGYPSMEKGSWEELVFDVADKEGY